MKKILLNKKSVFWITLLSLPVFCFYLSIIYLPKIIPLLKTKINADKEQILKKAKDLSKKYNIGPNKDFKQVIYFNSESNTQITKNKIYNLYTWQVRHFKENCDRECLIKFTPDGQFYGFTEHLPEDISGLGLSQEQAKIIAQEFLINELKINLSDYTTTLVSCETRANKRTDYIFIFEKTKYKLSVSICGDKITAVNHYINIPDFFTLKSIKLKSTGEYINALASIFMLIIYILGCFLSFFLILFLLVKNNFLISKQTIIIGFFISLVQLASQLNSISLIWINYNTTYSANTHLLKYILGTIAQFVISTVIYTAILSVTQGLTKAAFKSYFNSPLKLDYKNFIENFYSYIILSLNFIFIILFYILAQKIFGWQVSTTIFINTNILSTYIPGLSIAAQALSTSFWQECLFRAIPIAVGALIGQYLGFRKTIIYIFLIIQAIIFSAFYTDFFTLPDYIKFIELLVPSIIFGILYLFFGLFHVIIFSFVYNTLLLSLPIFISSAPKIWIDQSIISIILLMPLIINLINKLITKNPEANYQEHNQEYNNLTQDINNNNLEPEFNLSKYKYYTTLIFGLFGLIVYLSFINLESSYITSKTTKEEAISIAQEFIKSKNIIIDKNWHVLPFIYQPKNNKLTEKFLWQQGQEIYNNLKASYIMPSWCVRFAKFHTKQDQKAEEYKIFIKLDKLDKKIIRYKHIIPDQNNGAYLSEHEAIELSKKFISENFNLNPNNIKNITLKAIQRQSRKDWVFIFQDLTVNILDKAKPYIYINIAGDKIINFCRYIDLPEDWLEQEKNKTESEYNINTIKLIAFLILVIIAFFKYINLFKNYCFKFLPAFLFFLIYFTLTITQRILSWPEVIASFNISKSFFSQLISSRIAYFTNITIYSLVISFIFGFTTDYKNKNKNKNLFSGYKNIVKILLVSASLAFIILGSKVLLESLIISPRSLDNIFIGINTSSLITSYLIFIFIKYINNTVYFLIISKLAGYRLNLKLIFTLLLGTIIAIPYNYYGSLEQWLLTVLILFLVIFIIYIFIIRYELTLIPIISAIITEINLIYNFIIKSSPEPDYIVAVTIISIALGAYILVKILKIKLPEQITSKSINLKLTAKQ